MTFPTATQAHAISTAAASTPVDQTPIFLAVTDPMLAAMQAGLFTVTVNLGTFPASLVAKAVTRLTGAGYTASTDSTGLILTVSW